MMYKCDFC